jgi:ParB-like chromosome segregation protein Spo0J
MIMLVEKIPIGEVKPYQKNAKKHEKKQIKQVADSIKRFGWAQPLVVDKNNELIIGHCRLESAKL